MEDKQQLKNYMQWIEVRIVSEGMTITVSNAVVNWGKFFLKGYKGTEISAADIDKIEIVSGEAKYICACGRKDSPSGTTGSFNLFDNKKETIGHFRWNADYGNYTNSSFKWIPHEGSKKFYHTTCEGGSQGSGALGNVTITCIKK